MSYDVTIGDFEGNYTYNLANFFRAHMPGGITNLDGLSGRQACNVMAGFFASVQSEAMRTSTEEMRRKYDAPNGWGSLDGALTFAGQIAAACGQFPRHVVRVT